MKGSSIVRFVSKILSLEGRCLILPARIPPIISSMWPVGDSGSSDITLVPFADAITRICSSNLPSGGSSGCFKITQFDKITHSIYS